MQKTSRLTSRNLFDDVFATIPANIVLYTGPESLREKYALVEDRRAEDAVDERVGDKGDQDVTNASGVDNGDVPGASSPTDAVVMDLSAMMRHAAETRVTRPTVGTPSQYVLNFGLDANDEAVREATKYAALISDDKDNDNDVEHRDGNGKPDDSTPAAQDGEKKQRGVSHTRPPHRVLSAEEQIALLLPGNGRRHEGRSVLFRHTKGFGFVAPSVGGPDVYFTRESVEFFFTRRVLEVFYEGKLPGVMKRRDLSQTSGRDESGGIKKNNTSLLSVAPSGITADCTNRDGDEAHSAEGMQRAVDELGMGVLEPKMETEADITPAADNELVKRAAAILTPEAARLLLFFLQVGQPVVSVSETLTFTVRWNRAGNRSVRRLRADNISGVPAKAYALVVEQAWFGSIFHHSVERRGERKNSCVASVDARKNEEQNEETMRTDAAAKYTSCLLRYRGTVRMYDADELRGSIRPDGGGSQDVFFYGDAILWASWMEPARCRPAEGLVVRYSVTGCDRHGQQIATLITADDNTPMSDANAVWASSSGGAGGDDRGGRDGKSGGKNKVEKHEGGWQDGVGGGKARNEEVASRKRGHDDELLLLEEDDYGIM